MFAWHPVYNNYKESIELTLDEFKKRGCEYYEMFKSMIPKYVDKDEIKK
jgi:hypothetical protein